ncbi:SWR1 complex subunit 2 isoform X2 [Pyrus x bretschneideri]|uniref:SWR1 complex subunit 2 isoform X2 n=1 Tax=Pyrus x bretschneideri TaxID=225117 RepID=UPI00202EB568|nr:SWR1 complex subunit 2 isoform X2 [Pyrus x bretschneideri]
MEVPKDEPPAVFLDRTSRATRGKRMTKLLDEEIEEDEMFWNQEALKEDEDDGNYEAEPEVADEFDSDFDEDEPDPDEGAENDATERVRTKKRLIYPGKQSSKKKKKKKKVISELESKDGNEKSSHPKQHQDAPEEAEVERTVRKSTRTSVVVRQAERDAIRAALQATMKPIKRKKEGEEKRMTQEEMLLEAAQTEIMNLRNLERVLAREEEVKKRAIVHKAVYTGPQVRYFSKDGRSYLEFSKGLSFQSEISTAPVPYPEKAACAVTGLPAKYRDPKTGLPYATKEAFNIIRQRYGQNSLFYIFFYRKVVGSGKRWTWVTCTVHLLVRGFRQGGRDQWRQITLIHRTLDILHVSAEFQLLKANHLIRFHEA